MGFLDKWVSKVGLSKSPAAKPATPGAARPAAPAPAPIVSGNKAPAGPLNLVKGDFVTHYRERFAVVGHRVLESDGGAVLLYCLKNKNGAAAVLACEGGSDAAFTLQRAVKADVKWDADVLDGIAEEPLRIVRKGRAKVRAWDDSGLPADVRSVEFRRYADASGDVVLCLDDYQGKREIRLGEPVYEAEMEFERGAGAGSAGSRTAAMSRAKTFEDAADDEVVKGTPRAAAKALEQNMGAKKTGAKSATPDHDPTAYDDDKWIDAVDEKPKAKPRAAQPAVTSAAADDDDDEWTSASQLVRQSGANAIVDDDDPGVTR
jgi:hypothetical protein